MKRAILSLLLVAGCNTVDVGPPLADVNACRPSPTFFVEQVWPNFLAQDHNGNPYSYNREFIYKWISAQDGGWDLKRIRPDPVFDCAGGNIPAGAKTVCNS